MKTSILTGSAVSLVALLVSTGVGAHSHASASCDLKVKLTKAAEMHEGGAQYKGKLGAAMASMKMGGTKAASDKMGGMKMDAMKTASDKMGGMKMGGAKGAHEVHEGQYGGTFFMAPNKTHHVEGQYSEKCGFSLVLFNAMTEPINVSRFKAFVKFIPEDEDQGEVYRFLSASHDGSVMRAPKGPQIKGAFDIEMYVDFPGKDEPELFNIPGRKKGHQ